MHATLENRALPSRSGGRALDARVGPSRDGAILQRRQISTNRLLPAAHARRRTPWPPACGNISATLPYFYALLRRERRASHRHRPIAKRRRPMCVAEPAAPRPQHGAGLAPLPINSRPHRSQGKHVWFTLTKEQAQAEGGRDYMVAGTPPQPRLHVIKIKLICDQCSRGRC